MTISIPDIYLAFCGGALFGAASLVGLVYVLIYSQRRRNRRP